MSAQPGKYVGPPEGPLAGLIPPDIEALESAGTTEFGAEPNTELLDRLEWSRAVLAHLRSYLANTPAFRSLPLGARFSWREGSGLISVLPDRQVEQTFNRLAQQWRTETGSISSPCDKFLHPAYLQIIGMGYDVVPLLLREVKRMSGQWFLALRSITRQDAVTDSNSTSVRDMTAAWLRWGREQGYNV